MKIHLGDHDKSGFSIVETILVIAAVGIIAGLAFVYLTRSNTTQSSTANQTDNSASAEIKTAAPVGTTDSVTELVVKAVESEAEIDSSADIQIQADSTSADSAITNLGGAYDASSL